MGKYFSKYFKGDTREIRVECEEVIRDITTKRLEDELEERNELRHENLEEFNKLERTRDNIGSINIDLDDYGLMNTDDIEPDFFSDKDLIFYLETHKNYAVFSKNSVGSSNADSVCNYLIDLPKWKLKEFMCDALGLNHFATTDDILNELKLKLN